MSNVEAIVLFKAFGWVRKAEDKKAADVSLGWTGSIEWEEARISWPFMSEHSEGTAFSVTQWGIVWMQEQEGRRGACTIHPSAG